MSETRFDSLVPLPVRIPAPVPTPDEDSQLVGALMRIETDSYYAPLAVANEEIRLQIRSLLADVENAWQAEEDRLAAFQSLFDFLHSHRVGETLEQVNRALFFAGLLEGLDSTETNEQFILKIGAQNGFHLHIQGPKVWLAHNHKSKTMNDNHIPDTELSVKCESLNKVLTLFGESQSQQDIESYLTLIYQDLRALHLFGAVASAGASIVLKKQGFLFPDVGVEEAVRYLAATKRKRVVFRANPIGVKVFDC